MSWLEAMGAKVPKAQSRMGWIQSDCPFGHWRHENGKSGPDAFGVRLETGVPFCNCFSCGYNGDAVTAMLEIKYAEKNAPSGIPRDFVTASKLTEKADNEFELEFDDTTIEDVLNTKSSLKPFDEDWLASFGQAVHNKIAREYLKERSTPLEVSEALDLRWDGSQQRICFPVRDFGGRLMGLHGRTIHKGVEPRYRMYNPNGYTNPIVWLGEHWIETSKPILVVEGPFDVASAVRVYRNTCSPLFANPSFEKIHRMADCLEVVTLLDTGKAGDQGRARFLKSMPGSIVTNLVPSTGIKDPGAATVEELQGMLSPYLDLDEPVY